MSALPPKRTRAVQLEMSAKCQKRTFISLVAAVALVWSSVFLVGQLEPSFGDLEQFGLFFFASSLLRGSQSFLSKATILFSLADHGIAAETFRKNPRFWRGWAVANWI